MVVGFNRKSGYVQSMLGFRRASHLLPKNIPIILETPVSAERIEKELEKVGWLIG